MIEQASSTTTQEKRRSERAHQGSASAAKRFHSGDIESERIADARKYPNRNRAGKRRPAMNADPDKIAWWCAPTAIRASTRFRTERCAWAMLTRIATEGRRMPTTISVGLGMAANSIERERKLSEGEIPAGSSNMACDPVPPGEDHTISTGTRSVGAAHIYPIIDHLTQGPRETTASKDRRRNSRKIDCFRPGTQR